MLHVISRGSITPLYRGYNHRFFWGKSPCEAPRLKMGFLWDPILGKLNWEANLERGRSRSLLKVSSCRQENRVWSRGVNVLTRQLRNVCWETFWGLVSWKWKKHPSFFIANWKMMVRAEFQTLAKLASKPRWWFQLFSNFFLIFFWKFNWVVQPPPWNDIHQIHSSRIPVLLSLHKVYILIYFPQIQIDIQQIMFPKSL